MRFMSEKRIAIYLKSHLIVFLSFIVVFLIASSGCPSTEGKSKEDLFQEKYGSKRPTTPFKSKDVVKLGSVPSDWTPYKIAVEGDYSYVVDCAFLATDSQFKTPDDKPSNLHIIDNNNKAGPKLIKSLCLEGKGWDIAVKNGYAYVATANGLLTINVNKPNSPRITDRFTTPDHATKVFINDKFLYLLDSSKRLIVLHLKNSSKPVQIYSKQIGSDSPYTGFMEFDSEYAYISGTYSGLHVYDISDPVNLERICILDISTPYSVVRYGDYLYLGIRVDRGGKEIAIYDFSNPVNSKKVSSFAISEWAIKSVIHDDKLYLFCADGNVPVYDLTDPVYPSMIGKRTTGMKTSDLWVDDDKIISINKTGDFQICSFDWNIEKDGKFQVLDSINTPRQITDFVIEREHIYAVGDPPGLYTYDVSNPSDPRLINNIILPGGSKRIAVSGDYVYVKNANPMSTGDCISGGDDSPEESMLRIYNVNNPDNPFFVGSAKLPKNAGRIVTNGKILLGEVSSSGWEGSSTEMFAVDVSNPSSPVTQKTTFKGEYIHDFEFQDEYVYTVCGKQGLLIYKIETPFNLKLVSKLNDNKWATGLAVSGNRAYVANQGAVNVINISNPHMPSIIETLNALSSARDLVLDNHFAYVQRGMSGLVIVDLKDQSKRPEILNLGSNHGNGPIAVKGDYIFYLDSGSNFSIQLKSKKISDSVYK